MNAFPSKTAISVTVRGSSISAQNIGAGATGQDLWERRQSARKDADKKSFPEDLGGDPKRC